MASTRALKVRKMLETRPLVVQAGKVAPPLFRRNSFDHRMGVRNTGRILRTPFLLVPTQAQDLGQVSGNRLAINSRCNARRGLFEEAM